MVSSLALRKSIDMVRLKNDMGKEGWNNLELLSLGEKLVLSFYKKYQHEVREVKNCC